MKNGTRVFKTIYPTHGSFHPIINTVDVNYYVTQQHWSVRIKYLPVRRLAADFVAPNSVSRYFGRKTTKPLTIDTSQQMPKHVTM